VTKNGEVTTHDVIADLKSRRPLRHLTTVSRSGVKYMASNQRFQFIEALRIEAPK
jgi:uncharacterized NAD(P)/FAD-binding protein YdhS